MVCLSDTFVCRRCGPDGSALEHLGRAAEDVPPARLYKALVGMRADCQRVCVALWLRPLLGSRKPRFRGRGSSSVFSPGGGEADLRRPENALDFQCPYSRICGVWMAAIRTRCRLRVPPPPVLEWG